MTKTFQFNLFIEEREDQFVGYCMEMGLVVRGLGLSEVLKKIGEVTFRHFEFAVGNNRLADIYRPVSSQEVWNRFAHAKEQAAIAAKTVRADSQTSFTMNQNAYATTCAV